MKSPLKNLKKYFQLIMTALICFVMGELYILIRGNEAPYAETIAVLFQLMNLRQFSRILCSDEQDQYALFTRIAI